MTRSSAVYHRTGSRALPKLIQIGFGFVLVLLIWFGLRSLVSPFSWRHTTAFVSADFVHVVSWNAQRSHVVVLDVPKKTVIAGTRGYGNYSAASLFSLDNIDNHNGKMFVESLSDALGLPITGLVDISTHPDTTGSIDWLRSTYSWSSIFAKDRRIGISWREWISYVISTRLLKADEVVTYSAQNIVVDQQQPDGSVQSWLDPGRLDYVYAEVFADTTFRTEAISVAVYNTTAIPGVGQKAARLLTQVGIPVVLVDNDEQELERCEVFGSASALRSTTAQFIRTYFNCTVKEAGEDAQAYTSDITLRLGSAFASVYQQM